jgi:hypothetical protein
MSYLKTTDIVTKLRERTDCSTMLLCDPPKPAPDRLCHDAADEIERLRSRSETLEAALREMESAFVLLAETMHGSEIGIPLGVGLIIIKAREVARAAMSKENDAKDGAERE